MHQNCQTKKDTLEDLFRTFVAGFRLLKFSANHDEMPVKVCTRPIPCPSHPTTDMTSFKHDSKVVFLLQLLAAQYVGVDKIELFAYSK